MERSQVYGGWLEGQDPITAVAHEGAVRILREALEKEINTAWVSSGSILERRHGLRIATGARDGGSGYRLGW